MRLSAASALALRQVDECGATIELIDDVENVVIDLVRRHIRQRASVRYGGVPWPRFGVNQLVRRLVHPVVDECVGRIEAEYEAAANGVLQREVELLLRFLRGLTPTCHVRGVAQTGERFQRVFRLAGKRSSFAAIRSTTLSVNPLAWMRSSPNPRPCLRIERERAAPPPAP